MSDSNTESTGKSIQTSLAIFAGQQETLSKKGGMNATGELQSRVTVHQDDLAPLLDRGAHAESPTELVLMPLDLHRRVFKQRLSSAEMPRDAHRLTEPVDVAGRVLEPTGDSQPSIVDRIDRIPLLEELLRTETAAADAFERVLGTPAAESVKSVEQARTEIESVTGYHPTRVGALRKWCASRATPPARDGRDLLEATLTIEERLRERTGKATSTGAVVRRAARVLSSGDVARWESVYPSVERVWVCGLSTIPASLVDLVASILATTNVEAHLVTRPVSGPVLAERLWDGVAVADPGQEVFQTE